MLIANLPRQVLDADKILKTNCGHSIEVFDDDVEEETICSVL
jgi:hypothetical protein